MPTILRIHRQLDVDVERDNSERATPNCTAPFLCGPDANADRKIHQFLAGRKEQLAPKADKKQSTGSVAIADKDEDPGGNGLATEETNAEQDQMMCAPISVMHKGPASTAGTNKSRGSDASTAGMPSSASQPPPYYMAIKNVCKRRPLLWQCSICNLISDVYDDCAAHVKKCEARAARKCEKRKFKEKDAPLAMDTVGKVNALSWFDTENDGADKMASGTEAGKRITDNSGANNHTNEKAIPGTNSIMMDSKPRPLPVCKYEGCQNNVKVCDLCNIHYHISESKNSAKTTMASETEAGKSTTVNVDAKNLINQKPSNETMTAGSGYPIQHYGDHHPWYAGGMGPQPYYYYPTPPAFVGHPSWANISAPSSAATYQQPQQAPAAPVPDPKSKTITCKPVSPAVCKYESCQDNVKKDCDFCTSHFHIARLVGRCKREGCENIAERENGVCITHGNRVADQKGSSEKCENNINANIQSVTTKADCIQAREGNTTKDSSLHQTTTKKKNSLGFFLWQCNICNIVSDVHDDCAPHVAECEARNARKSKFLSSTKPSLSSSNGYFLERRGGLTTVATMQRGSNKEEDSPPSLEATTASKAKRKLWQCDVCKEVAFEDVSDCKTHEEQCAKNCTVSCQPKTQQHQPQQGKKEVKKNILGSDDEREKQFTSMKKQKLEGSISHYPGYSYDSYDPQYFFGPYHYMYAPSEHNDKGNRRVNPHQQQIEQEATNARIGSGSGYPVYHYGAYHPWYAGGMIHHSTYQQPHTAATGHTHINSNAQTQAARKAVQKERPKESSKSPPWTPDEDAELKRLVTLHGLKRWSCISTLLQSRRLPRHCKDRWVNHLSLNIDAVGEDEAATNDIAPIPAPASLKRASSPEVNCRPLTAEEDARMETHGASVC